MQSNICDSSENADQYSGDNSYKSDLVIHAESNYKYDMSKFNLY